MPIAKELAIRMYNRPGSLGKVCSALADRGVKIIALQSFPSERTILVCVVVDNPEAAAAVLDREGMTYTEAEVAQVKFTHWPGELAGAASKLGEANININYTYCGVEPNTNEPVVIFGVGATELSRTETILEQTAAAARAIRPGDSLDEHAYDTKRLTPAATRTRNTLALCLRLRLESGDNS